MSQHFLRNLAPFALVIGLACTGIAATGCGAQGPDTESGSPAAAQEGATATAQDAAAATGDTAHLRGHGGPEMLLRASLRELTLSADQTTKINALIDAMHPAPPPAGAAPKAPTELFSTLATQVRANKIDATALQAKIDAVKADPNRPTGDRGAKMAASLQSLHDILTSDQRTQLVTSIKAKMAAHETERAAHEAEHQAHEGKGGHGAPFLHGIDLTDEQRTQIETALSNAGIEKPGAKDHFADMKAHATALLDAFPADKFDAASLMPAPPSGEGPEQHMTNMVKAMSVVVPLLTDAQRTQLATNLEKGPFAHGPGGRGEPPPDAL